MTDAVVVLIVLVALSIASYCAKPKKRVDTMDNAFKEIIKRIETNRKMVGDAPEFQIVQFAYLETVDGHYEITVRPVGIDVVNSHFESGVRP